MMRHHRRGPRGRVPALLSMTVTLAVLAACGTDSPTDRGGGGDGTPVLSLSSSAEALAGTQGGPNPTAPSIDVSNGGDGTLSGLAASVACASGQPNGWLSATLSGAAAPATLALEADIVSLAVGAYEATVEVSASGVSEAETIAVTLVLDLSAPPTIEITSPTRAAMLAEGTIDASGVQITGTACHDSVPIETLTVNGEEIAVSGTSLCEPFDVTQSSEWGMSVIEVYAESAYGRSADAVQSYLRSPEYYPVALTPDASARVPSGIFGRLNDAVIDDGNRNDFDDIGTIVEAWVDAYDVNAGLPTTAANPYNAGVEYVDDCGLWDRNANVTGVKLSRTGSVSTGGRSVSLEATSSGLTTDATIGSLSSPVRAEGWQDTGCLLPDLHAAVSGDLLIQSLGATVTVDPVATAGGLTTPGVSVSTTLSTPEIDVDWGILDFLDFPVNGVVNSFSDLLGGHLRSEFGQQLESELPALVEELFESFDVNATSAVNGADVAYEGPLDYIDFGGSRNGWAQVGLGVQVRPGGAAVHPSAPFGAIRADATTPSFTTEYDFGVGIADDLVNQVYWAAWQGGSFEAADIGVYNGETYPGLSGAVSPLLPPVVTASSGAHLVDVHWGDIHFAGFAHPAAFGLPGFQSGDSVPVEAHATVIAGLDIAYDDAAERLVGTIGATDVRVAVGAEVGSPLDEPALTAAVEAAVADFVETALPAGLAGVQIPVIDLSGFAGVPANTVIRLQSATVEREGRYIKLTGAVGN